MILQVLIAMIAGWINRQQQQVIAYLLEENRTLHAKLGDRRLHFTDAERRRLAALAFPLGRKRLTSLATLATPDTLMRWDNQIVAQKFDGSHKRNKVGRPRVSDEIEARVWHMANDNLLGHAQDQLFDLLGDTRSAKVLALLGLTGGNVR